MPGGDHLVGVHVRDVPDPVLEDVERELIVPLPSATSGPARWMAFAICASSRPRPAFTSAATLDEASAG